MKKFEAAARKLYRIIIFALVILTSGINPSGTFAAEPVTTPQLRVETGMHTTLIRRVIPDLPRNRLITCSDDKTIRVWQMPEMRLLSVLRVPLDKSHEGQLYAVAVSPDGRTVAAGGWTGWDWDRKASIYFFDVMSGEIITRLAGFSNVVNALAWMPDGQHLAIGLQGSSGFLVMRLSDGKVAAVDPQYKDDIMDLDVSVRGRIVATSLDGYVRLYNRDFKLIGRRVIAGGKRPISVRFSPDADMIAIGFIDVPMITVISARDMAFKHHVNGEGIKDQVGFTSVVWSSDGRSLYASGQYSGDGLNPVYRWQDQGQGKPEIIPLTQNRITEVQQMPDNHIAFAAEDPGVGVMGPDGKLEMFRGPDIANFSSAQKQLSLSADAAVVGYPLYRNKPAGSSFAVFGPGDQDTAAKPDVPMSVPILESESITVTDWKDGFQPKINGKIPKLEEYEFSRCYAFAPDGKSVLLGTEWAIRLLRPDATEVWHVALPAVAWSVNVSRNGLLAAAALSDGTIRWYRMQDGEEVLAYFPHSNGRDWIAWVPDGYYMSSVYGDNFIGWHLNRGRDLTPDFYRAVQFDRILYRPDVVTAQFRQALGPATRNLEAAPQGADFRIAKLREIAPPRLRLGQPEVRTGANGRSLVTLELKGEKNALAIRDYCVYVNNIPVTHLRERRLSGNESERFQRRIQLELSEKDNEIRIESFNGVSMGVVETYLGLAGKARGETAKGDLYMLAVGVNAFPALPRRNHLKYAAQDADELGRVLAGTGARNFSQIKLHTITDLGQEKPEKKNVLAALKFVEQAGPNDTVVIFLASHGISDLAGNYYFVPRDVVPQDLARAQKGEKAESMIPWTAFFDALRDAAGRRVLIVDTCQARSIEGKFEAHSLMKRSAASQFALIVASKGNEESQEYAPAKHGLFTYALLRSLGPDADADSDGRVTLKRAFDRAFPIVQELRHKQAGPQTPQMVAPKILADMPLVTSARAGGN